MLIAEDEYFTAFGRKFSDGIIDLLAHLQSFNITHYVVSLGVIVVQLELGNLLHAVGMVADHCAVLDDIECTGIDDAIEESLDVVFVFNVFLVFPKLHEGFLHDVFRLVVVYKACGIEGKRGV